MKGKTFRAISLLLSLVLLAGSMVGCAGTKEPQATTRTVVDQLGKTVTIPVEVNHVVTPYPMATNIVYTLDGKDKLVGIDDNTSTNTWMQKIDPNISKITKVGMPQSVNVETILSLKPDVVIGAFGDVRTQLENVGIPVIGLNLVSGSDLESAVSLIGKVIGKEDNAKALNNYYDEKMNLIKARTSTIPTEKRVRVLCIGRDNIYTAAIGGCYQDKMIESAGGINVAHDLTGQGWFTQVSIEQILSWNPEVILVPSYIRQGSAADILKDPQWQSIDAVKNGRVYTIPQGVSSWDTPVPESFLCPIWIAQLLYPDKFADININQEVRNFYSKFYHLNVTDNDIKGILYLTP